MLYFLAGGGGGGISVNFVQLYKASLSRPLSISSVTVAKLDARLPHYSFGLNAINTDGGEELCVARFRYRVDVGAQL
jgi:hypothetical protein